MNNQQLLLTTVFLKDKKGRGYTGYFAEFPDLTAQGNTKEELERNLLTSLLEIFDYNRNQDVATGEYISKETHSYNLVACA